MIEVRVRHAFEDTVIDVAFEAPAGVTALFGRSGAGKTTVLSAIAGLMTPQEGRIVAGGRVLFDAASGVNLAPARRRIGTVFQDGRLFPHMSVLGNLKFAERFAARPATQRERLIALLGLEALLTRRPAMLSGGEKQRVAIARALLSEPDALLLDEPLAALDDARKAEIMPYLERLARDASMPILYVSHALPEVARLADRVVLMRSGRSVATGAVSTVFTDVEAAAVMGFRDAGALLTGRVFAHDPADGLTEVALSACRLVLPAIDAPAGTPVRIRLRASEVIVALEPPGGLSTRNVLPAVVEGIVAGDGPGALVSLAVGEDRIMARLTQRSVRTLGLAPGSPCFAVLKAFAVPPEDVVVLAG
ncbi:molybdenum ABC transporter ATP-binding protein [Acuticoccus sp. MNP-M23]|uniref:molybdenum ABC transporter ATP-binding protein n=1 Tax=Acuticoccus sp. MNP-M23 TaxID=3072793 RepID=UPI002815B839|nr:molybdenum ABC transporter ATP-binding protein [Acuticoccus sp. MNP-M23]WMS43731.1 molybdenum ABC transporter ATP-binding protein [Acuticoccus sp. MNP-M23]